MREALRLTLEMMDLDVICSASGAEFLERYRPTNLGCLIVDLRMAGMSGLELLERLAEQDIGLPAVMISGHGDVPAAVRAMKEGVIDFLEKPYRIDDLRDAVRRAIEFHRQSRSEELRKTEIKRKLEQLTAAEREILEWTIDGLPDKAIAARAGVSTRTVQLRRASLMKKLEARTRVQLARMAQALEVSG